ncbi:hypothetical protein B0H19DRAFT_1371581 [Mycena capillaripes]|nr:hypothetical protein B0H19DRAFT_1371581 [Mycena capillaripes]
MRGNTASVRGSTAAVAAISPSPYATALDLRGLTCSVVAADAAALSDFYIAKNRFFVEANKLLGSTTIAALFQRIFKRFVNWNHKTVPIVAAWLLRTDAPTIVNLVKKHRRLTLLVSALLCVVPGLLILPVIILTALGFEYMGIRQGSPAAAYQSNVYGGFTPASSLFARLESAGMRYMNNPAMDVVGLVVSLSAGLLAIFAWNLE